MAKATKSTVQVKRKRWVQIVAPKMLNEMSLGETYVEKPSDAIGRTVKVSVMHITGEPQKQYVSAGFKIVSAPGDKLQTVIKSYRILPNSLRRLVRRNKDKFDDSIEVTTSDGALMRVKPFVVTRFHTKGSVRTALRAVTRAKVTELAASMTVEQFFLDLISHKIQRAMYEVLRKTYPVQVVEIKMLNILKEATGKPAKPAAEEKPEAEKPAEKEAAPAKKEEPKAEAPVEKEAPKPAAEKPAAKKEEPQAEAKEEPKAEEPATAEDKPAE